MNKVSLIENKKTDRLVRTVVACIKQSTDDDVKRYLGEFRPGTTNGLPHQIHDWINGNLRDHITSDNVHTMEIKRASWKGLVIVDEENKNVYSIMRTGRLNILRQEKRDRPHYLQTIVGVLNNELEGRDKQLPLFDYNPSSFSQEVLKDDYNKLFGSKIDPAEGYTHCLILFATRGTDLKDVRICVVDRDLVVVEDKSLVEFIRPDYADLTGIKPYEDITDDLNATQDDNLTTQPSKPLIKLKVIEKLSND